MQGKRTAVALVGPVAAALVDIDSNPGPKLLIAREVRQDEGDMPLLRDDRVVPVRPALAVAVRMNMHIGDDSLARLAAMLPERTELATVQDHDTGCERAGVNIVIVDELVDPAHAPLVAEKECAAFTDATRSAVKLPDALHPGSSVTDQPWPSTEGDARERCC